MYRSTSNLYILIPFLTLWTPLPTQSSLEKLCNVSQYPHITWVTSALPLHMVMKQYSNIFRHYSTRGPHSPIITHDVSGMFQQAPFFHPSAFCSSASHSIWGKHFLEEENILQEQKIHAIWIFLFRQTHFPGKGALLQKPKVWFGSTVLLLCNHTQECCTKGLQMEANAVWDRGLPIGHPVAVVSFDLGIA